MLSTTTLAKDRPPGGGGGGGFCDLLHPVHRRPARPAAGPFLPELGRVVFIVRACKPLLGLLPVRLDQGRLHRRRRAARRRRPGRLPTGTSRGGLGRHPPVQILGDVLDASFPFPTGWAAVGVVVVPRDRGGMVPAAEEIFTAQACVRVTCWHDGRRVPLVQRDHVVQ